MTQGRRKSRRKGQTGRLGFQACSDENLNHGDECNCNYTLIERVARNTWRVQYRDGDISTLKFVSPAEYHRHF